MHTFSRSNRSWCFIAILFVSSLHAQTQPSAQSSQPPLPTISSAPSARIIPPPPNYAFPNGQTYVYGIEWHLFNAGTSEMTLALDGGQEHVTAIANSAGRSERACTKCKTILRHSSTRTHFARCACRKIRRKVLTRGKPSCVSITRETKAYSMRKTGRPANRSTWRTTFRAALQMWLADSTIWRHSLCNPAIALPSPSTTETKRPKSGSA